VSGPGEQAARNIFNWRREDGMNELALIARAASRLAADDADTAGQDDVTKATFVVQRRERAADVACVFEQASGLSITATYTFPDDGEPTFDASVKSGYDLPGGAHAGVEDSADGAPAREIVDVVATHLEAAQPGQTVQIEARRL
jgi:hypothetical protein